MSEALLRLPSPYKPGYNKVPEVLAGRDDILASTDYALERAAVNEDTPPAIVLVGARGVGKSVLLAEVAERAAERYGWPRLVLDTPRSGHLVAVLAERSEALRRILADQKSPKRFRVTGATMRAGIAGLGGELHMSAQPAEATEPLLEVEHALLPLLDEAAKRATGVILTLDEAQDGSPEHVAALGAFHQRAVENDWPLVLVAAGLPDLRKTGFRSSFERAEWFDVGLLSPAATLQALAEPAARTGRPYEQGAAQELAGATGGYPYAVQVYGDAAWRASQGQRTIGTQALGEALAFGQAQMERNLYSERWKKSPQRERDYLVAVASELMEVGPVTGASVARRLGKTGRELSSYRERLIDKGTLVADGTYLTFVVPGFADYVLRQIHNAYGTSNVATGPSTQNARARGQAEGRQVPKAPRQPQPAEPRFER